MVQPEHWPPQTANDEPPYQTRDLNVLASTLAAAEFGADPTRIPVWVSAHAPHADTIGFLNGILPGPGVIINLEGALGSLLRHVLLRYEPRQAWPHAEQWDLDYAVADPLGYRQSRLPTWLNKHLTATEPIEPDVSW